MRLAQRLWILLTLTVFVSLVAYGFLGAREHRRQLIAEAEQEVGEAASLLVTVFSEVPERADRDELHRLGEKLSGESRVLGVGFFDDKGQWAGGSHSARESAAELRTYVHRALATNSPFQGRVSLSGRPCVLGVEVLSPTHSRGAHGVLVVIRDLDYIDTALARLITQLALLGLSLTALMALAAWIAARTLTDPIEKFLVAVARVSDGDLSTALEEERGADEILRLARSFNALTRSLRATQARLADEQSSRSVIESELHRAQSLAVAGQVAATLGHEIGSPLNVILGRARLAAEREDLAEDHRATLDSIAAQAERITRIVAQFLNLARPPKRDPNPCTDASVVAREVVSFLGYECRRRKITAITEVNETAPAAAEHDRLFQVIFNVCLNAIQAQPDGGVLRVRTWRETGDEVASTKAIIEICDNGPGVAAEHRARLFDLFFSTRVSQGGTGLGLPVVVSTVKEYGGRVIADRCAEGDSLHGARFVIELPGVSETADGG